MWFQRCDFQYHILIVRDTRIFSVALIFQCNYQWYLSKDLLSFTFFESFLEFNETLKWHVSYVRSTPSVQAALSVLFILNPSRFFFPLHPGPFQLMQLHKHLKKNRHVLSNFGSIMRFGICFEQVYSYQFELQIVHSQPIASSSIMCIIIFFVCFCFVLFLCLFF